MDIQKNLLKQIRKKLKKEEKLVEVLMELLHISQDAAYRRINGKVALTIYETEKLLQAFEINFGKFTIEKKGSVSFQYNPLSRIQVDFTGYLRELRDGLRAVKNLQDPHLLFCVNETPVFQYFNFPHLLRFKFFFWSKSYLQLDSHKGLKFERSKIPKEALSIGLEAHNLYNSIPSTEIYCEDTLQGILRQLAYYYDTGQFADPRYVFELLDNVDGLIEHLKKEAECGHKFSHGSEPNNADASTFNMHLLGTYIPDNTYYMEHKYGSTTYFSHNIMNILSTDNAHYNSDSKFILNTLIEQSTPISGQASRTRDRFFNHLKKEVSYLRRRIEIEEEKAIS